MQLSEEDMALIERGALAAPEQSQDEWLKEAGRLVECIQRADWNSRNFAGREEDFAELSKQRVVDLFAHLRNHPASPEGYVLVPVEPTEEMCDAAWASEGTDYVDECLRIWNIALAYKAMIAVVIAASKAEKEQP